MAKSKQEMTVEHKLRMLYDLQLVDSRIDVIRNVRGELPLEIENLEDEVARLNARVENINIEIQTLEQEISNHKVVIENANTFIKKYNEQQKNVRNSREYNSIAKEIEYQELEIQLAQKKMDKVKELIEEKEEEVQIVQKDRKERQEHLDTKKKELDSIMKETEKEESALAKKSEEFRKDIEERLLKSYDRLRENLANGLAVVPIERGASSGSLIMVPSQIQAEVASRKRIITDEHSGCILVDPMLAEEEREKLASVIE